MQVQGSQRIDHRRGDDDPREPFVIRGNHIPWSIVCRGLPIVSSYASMYLSQKPRSLASLAENFQFLLVVSRFVCNCRAKLRMESKIA